MDTIWARKVTIERWRDPLTTKVNYRIRKLQEKVRFAIIRQTQDYEFKVELSDTKMGVNLEKHTYNCSYWQLKNISYVHALTCIDTIRDTNKETYTHLYFHTTRQKKCYSGMIQPIPSKDFWP